jgi:hypothetical protein
MFDHERDGKLNPFVDERDKMKEELLPDSDHLFAKAEVESFRQHIRWS